jgi:glycosyltransferase involved in cell wall biosynthesis
MDMFEKPMGGTELMFKELQRRMSDEHKEMFSIFNYIQDADFDKFTIFWNQLSYDQAAVEFLKDPEMVEKIGHFVFVSHWQAEKFRQLYGIPGFKTSVIKNAALPTVRRETGTRDKVKLCYTSTPWRGLDVLLASWEMLKPENAELHVFSSCKIYGPNFAENDTNYQELYDKCEELDGVVYRGSVDNFTLRKELPSFDILAYPNTFEETSCISVIEALTTGLKVVTSNLGALPETTEGWARMYPYMNSPELHAMRFANILSEEIEKIRNNSEESHLQSQMKVYNTRWTWDHRINEWNNLLNGLKVSISMSNQSEESN